MMAGIDETVAKTRAAGTHLTLEPSDDEITIKISRPDETPRLRNAELRLRVPARLAVTLEFRGEADLRGVAEVKFQAARGRTNVREVGAIRGEYVNGELEVLAVGEIDLKTQRTQVRIDGVKKTLVLESEHGEVRIQRVAGAAKLQLDRVECEADAILGRDDGPHGARQSDAARHHRADGGHRRWFRARPDHGVRCSAVRNDHAAMS